MKTLKWLAASLAALILCAAPAAAQSPFYFWWTTVDEQGRVYKTNTGGVGDVQCSVYRTNVHGAALLHATVALQGIKDNPTFSDANGRLHFYSTISDPVDLYCVYAYGGSTSVGKLDRFTHKIVIPRDAARNISRFAVNVRTGTVYQSVGTSLPQGALITDIIIQNLSPITGQTSHLSIGFTGNHVVGFSNSLAGPIDLTGSATNVGTGGAEFIRPSFSSGGSASTTHRGAALIYRPAGANHVAIEVPYLIHVASGLDVTFTSNGSTASPINAHVFVYWSKFHTSLNRSPAGQ
jgi:hypothetical protein